MRYWCINCDKEVSKEEMAEHMVEYHAISPFDDNFMIKFEVV